MKELQALHITENARISKPFSFFRKDHAGWNRENGTFDLKDVPGEIKLLLKRAGIRKRDMKNKDTALLIYKKIIDIENKQNNNVLLSEMGESAGFEPVDPKKLRRSDTRAEVENSIASNVGKFLAKPKAGGAESSFYLSPAAATGPRGANVNTSGLNNSGVAPLHSGVRRPPPLRRMPPVRRAPPAMAAGRRPPPPSGVPQAPAPDKGGGGGGGTFLE